ncbi:S8 family serine peptidase [Flavobacterium sp. 102]|uniref:S8 family serine peptidase n=1 Tax=Flavobacterium sp. 102 TaxID=2135623 RepID=UPI000EB41E1A|nr:S8 family serine peptidase [Flavobacterium sp. 102]RKS01160.1 putative secreted protein (Por secretion system target) [Flavobacterium sp. 102]
MKKNYSLLLLILFISGSVFGQSQENIKKITAEYDMAKLKEKEASYRKRATAEKQKAIATAKQRNWPIYEETPEGGIKELMALTPEGLPIYYTTDNVNAARTTRTNHLNTGGSLGLNLDGQGMTVRVWDGGNVRTNHTAFGSRVVAVDAATTNTILHATHVTGTMVASANPANVKGMASQANARTFDWGFDDAEVVSETMEGMLVSNHSYGTPISGSGTPLPSWYIGSYTYSAFLWDDIAYDAPYYLAVMSAGNEGGNNDNEEPIAFGFDKLVGNKGAKNNLVVANALDATTAADGTLTSAVTINPSSSQGPTDDYRIKPDITGNGTNVTSTSNSGTNATAPLSGTSMASPNVAGSLILLQQHYNNLTNSFMRASTLKGLVCHTADDAGEEGPDAVFGWGLLNCKKAAETLTNNGLSSWVSEENLANGQEYTITVNSNGTTPLIASITWTDVPGAINTGGFGANDPTPALVNDLDIRVVKNTTTYFPWKLDFDPNSPAIRIEDNNVDNVEQVKIDAPTAGQYTITVNHKGALVSGSQKFSLVITGLTSNFALNSTSDNLTVCSDQNAVYTFNYTQSGGGSTTFSAVDLPTGASATFSPTSLSSNGSVTMTVSGLSGITPGEYFVGIKGTGATETETRFKILRVFNGTSFQPVALQTPTNAQNGLSTTALLKWDTQPNALTYSIQVSQFPNFSSLFITDEVTNNQYNISGLAEATRYYWRVIPQNNCGTATTNNAIVYYFDTGNLVCNINFAADDYSDAIIADVPNSSASVPLTITGGYTIGDLNVNINISHTWVQDMTIVLEGPVAIGSPIITLLEEACGGQSDIDCTMDDDGTEPACAGSPAISGSITPVNPLSALNTLPADGIWTLRVVDPYNEDGGIINSFSIDICNVEAALSVISNPILNSRVYPNPTKGIVNVAIPSLIDKATITLFDLQGRAIMTKDTNQVYTSFGIENLQDGVYLVNIANDQGAVTKKIVLRRN